ncbi:MAG: GMC family oxidoreductase, partial [Thermodesulfobacteriota bacterium]
RPCVRWEGLRRGSTGDGGKKEKKEKKEPKVPMQHVALALAQTLLGGEADPPMSPDELLALMAVDLSRSALFRRLFFLLMCAVNAVSLVLARTTFSRLWPKQRADLLQGLLQSRSSVSRGFGNLALLPFKYYFSGSEQAHALVGAPFVRTPPPPEPEPRWMSQITHSGGLSENMTLEAEVVVVGTGAGGAVVAKELAEQGVAVALFEEGKLWRRESFDGNPDHMMPRLYRAAGFTATVGNTVIPLPMGRAVGGTTLINSGTCFRTPEAVLAEWAGMGMPELAPERMAPFFEKVEKQLRVSVAEDKYIGPVGEIIRRGCEALGYSGGPLSRNAVDCDGQAVCTQGCPTDAKQSTNISYIPAALSAGARLFTGLAVHDIITDGRRALGVRARGRKQNGEPVTVTCFARKVVLSCGALLTPALLRQNGLAGGNPWVGGNLSLHPASYVGASFPGTDMRNPFTIPQGYCCDQFHSRGIMMEGGTGPFKFMALGGPGIGSEYLSAVAEYPHTAVFGFMVRDSAHGRVLASPGGLPVAWYRVSPHDMKRLTFAMQALGEIFLAAGAEKLILPTFYRPVVRNGDELHKAAARPWKPHNMILSAFHASGTARMGVSPKTSATDPNHRVHHVPGLYVVDASSLPTSPGVNPQVTIMALAARAAGKIAENL